MAGGAQSNRFAATAAKRSAPTPTPGSAPGSAGERMSKYTVLLTTKVATELDEALLKLRRHAGRKVDKSEVIRTLVDLLHADEALFNQVARRITSR